jgi:DNA-binding NarL/FixJ family response regulator
MSNSHNKKAPSDARDSFHPRDADHSSISLLVQAQQALYVDAISSMPRPYAQTSAIDTVAKARLFSSSESAANSAIRSNQSSVRVTHAPSHTQAATVASVLVVDAQPLMREALARLLAEHHTAVDVILVASIEAAAAHASQRFDLLVLDLNLPGFKNFDSLVAMRAQRPGVPVVVMATGEDESTVLGAIEAGAMGFIPKHYSREAIGNALSLVLAGGVYLPPVGAHATELVPHEFRRRASDKPMTAERRSGNRRAVDQTLLVDGAAERHGNASAPAPIPKLPITPRQSQVLSLLINGLCNKAISNKLSLSQNTVKSHIAAIFRAMGVNNRTQAVVEMSRKGYQMVID